MLRRILGFAWTCIKTATPVPTFIGVSGFLSVVHNRGVAAGLLWLNREAIDTDETSLREADVDNIRRLVQGLHPASEFILVVYGPQGVGKTTAVKTAVAGERGVMRLPVNSSLTTQEILDSVHKAIWPFAYVNYLSLHPITAAGRTIRFYTFLFQKSPCVILDVSSKPGEEVIPAHILSAAQDLCRAGLRVVVDASQGQLGTAPITGRALPYYIDFMDWEMVLEIPKFAKFFETLDELHLTNKVKGILGGCPRDIAALQEFTHGITSPERTTEVIKSFLSLKLGDAAKSRDDFLANLHDGKRYTVPDLKKLLEQGKNDSDAFGGASIPPNRVVRFVENGYHPRSPAMKIVLDNYLKSTHARRFIEDM